MEHTNEQSIQVSRPFSAAVDATFLAARWPQPRPPDENPKREGGVAEGSLGERQVCQEVRGQRAGATGDAEASSRRARLCRAGGYCFASVG